MGSLAGIENFNKVYVKIPITFTYQWLYLYMIAEQIISEIEIDSVKTLIDILDADKLQAEFHSHIRIWYRGQGNIEWPLQPKLYRQQFKPLNEKDRRDIGSHLSREFKSMSGAHLTGSESNEELYFLQQHYGLMTGLLDWTNNPLVALWFAVNEEPGLDGVLHMMDVYQMKNLHKNFGIALPSHGMFVSAIKNIYSFGSEGEVPSAIFPIRPDHKNQRITHQQSFFTFHVPNDTTLSEKNNPTLRRFRIPLKYKASIKKTLRLIGINSYFIFGTLDHLSKELEYAYIGRWHE